MNRNYSKFSDQALAEVLRADSPVFQDILNAKKDIGLRLNNWTIKISEPANTWPLDFPNSNKSAADDLEIVVPLRLSGQYLNLVKAGTKQDNVPCTQGNLDSFTGGAWYHFCYHIGWFDYRN